MTRGVAASIDGFSRLKVLVVGDAILDSYLEGSTSRVCREAPVPVVSLHSRRDVPGGAANTAVNLRALGAEVTLLGVAGADCEGELLRQGLSAHGVNTEHLLAVPGRQTQTKQRFLAASQILLRVDGGSDEPLDPPTESDASSRLARLFPRHDAVVISDYGDGMLTPSIIEQLAALQARSPRVVVVDSRTRLGEYRKIGPTAVKPNFEEAVALLGRAELAECEDRVEAILGCGKRILQLTGAQIAAVTLDTDGAVVFERGTRPWHLEARPMPQAQAAGAGDTFLSTFTLALASGLPTSMAAELAMAAAAVAVSQSGTSVCTADDLREQISSEGKHLDLGRLVARVELYRKQGRRIVFTNGCFDIIHSGHTNYLGRAKALGDVLIVAVNSDASIRRLKGPQRPINSLADRIQVLSALHCVDHVVSFDDDTCCDLVRVIRPDVYAKGGDYTLDKIPEAPLVEQLGGVVKILPEVEDRSTTGILHRIQKALARGKGPARPLRV